ncbi:MAG TPA: hypothetical protein VHQ94_16875 [Pyrinomonadaceae bacterium]|jgi:ABC-type multidrug transport system ATPase subunit|nr:hypothetical protein [Pyrinomonadaceae bacterium]
MAIARALLNAAARRTSGSVPASATSRNCVLRPLPVQSTGAALLNDPPIPLLDEPTRSLDPLAAAAARMRSFIGSLASGDPPVTILLTSHNLNEIEQLCQRITIISHGRIRELDTPDRIRTLHKARERVRFVLEGISLEHAVNVLAPALADVEVAKDGSRTVVTFSREVGDDRLDRGLRAILANGTRVVSCETERASLLEVLEAYEREEKLKNNGEL